MVVFKLAWRNVWRQKTRSLVIVLSISLGIWAGILMTGFAIGMVQNYLDNAILDIYSHIQIHHPDFKKDLSVKNQIVAADHLLSYTESLSDVEAVCVRSLVQGMASTSRSTRGVRIVGIDPVKEVMLTRVYSKIQEESYLNSSNKNKILISRKLADKMKLKIRSKIILTFQNYMNEITASAFRVSGIFQTSNQGFDESHVFILKTELDELISPEDKNELYTTEIAILTKSRETIDQTQLSIQNMQSENLVETYKDLSPDLNLYESQIENISLIYIVIIMLALIFGIINTMLMAVLERVRELGMLMSIGMKKNQVFGMIVSESIILALIAIPIGVVLSIVSIYILGETGINLTKFAEGAQRFGMSSIIYPVVPISAYFNIVIAVIITSTIASLYPALKAKKLNPVEAIRQI